MNPHAKFELKETFKSSIGWIVVTVFLLFVFLSFYPTFETQSNEFRVILENFPQEMLKAMGIEIDVFMSFAGFFSYVFNYIILIMSIYALNLGLSLMSKEQRLMSSDFLYAKPISRFRVLLNKLSLGLIFVIGFNLLILVIIFVMTNLFNVADTSILFEYWLSSLMITLTFLILGFLLGQVIKVKKTLPLASGITLGLFMVLLVARMIDLKWLQNITPFGWFESSDLLLNGLNKNNFFMVVGGLLLSILFLFVNQERRDLV